MAAASGQEPLTAPLPLMQLGNRRLKEVAISDTAAIGGEQENLGLEILGRSRAEVRGGGHAQSDWTWCQRKG